MGEGLCERRTRMLQTGMARHDVDAYLVLTLPDYLYFTGDFRKQPRAIIPRDGDPVILAFETEAEEVRRASWVSDVRTYNSLHDMMRVIIGYLEDRECDQGRLAVEMEFGVPAFLIDRFRMANPGVEVVPARNLVAPLRMFKSPEEVELMRGAARLADLGMEAALSALRPGVTENEVAAEAEYRMRREGALGVAFPTFVNSGHRSGWLHGMATGKEIEPGDLVVIDLGPINGGYVADLTRTAVVGQPTAEQSALHAAYMDAHGHAAGLLGRGMRVYDIDTAVQEVMDRRGFGDRFVRGFCHGIGLMFEETPFPTIFPEDALREVRPGMTVVVGHSVLSIPGLGGVRVEDTYWVRSEDEVERLTSHPQDLAVVG